MFSRPSLCLLLCAALVRAQTPAAPPPATPTTPVAPAPGDKIEHLDKFVVSAGPDPKTSFDLAQGTSVLAGDELRKVAQATLGDTLAATPGVASTYYGPGASRPVIRGLGGDRIRVLDNGVGALDASNVSPDHNAALEPLFASRIEVLRGPSTLLYGSSAVGGVVNVIDNTIPEAPADGRTAGVLELRAGGAADERAGVLSLGGGNKDVAVHVNALKQRTADTRIPGGTLADSATDTRSLGGGLSAFGAAGRAGFGVTRYETTYGVPTEERGTSIAMQQTRLDFSGELTQPFAFFRSAKARLGYGDYKHAELTDRTVTNTTFTNRAWEGRLELPHAALGPLTGTLGVQGARSDFAAHGSEVVTPPSLTQNGAVFALEELRLAERATLQFGARVESQTIQLGAVAPALPAVPGYAARSGEKKRARGVSGSAGVVVYPAKDWAIGATLAYTERLPTTQELFSNGPHAGTSAYEVGTSALRNERSLGFDLSVRRRAGFVTGSLGAFGNRFRDYIFEQALPAAAIPAANNPEGLRPFQFVARDATFYGGEAEVAIHFIDTAPRHLHLDLKSDYVHAEQTTDHEPLPRIPPLRYGAKLSYDNGTWAADLEARHVTRQDRFAPGESATPGYTLLNASVSYLLARDAVSWEFFLRGTNLADAEAREHTSFLKDFAPLPGRGVLGGVRVSF